MFRQAYPKNHQELLSGYIIERINWLNDVYEPESYVYRELKAWAEEYAREHDLQVPKVDWEEYIENEGE